MLLAPGVGSATPLARCAAIASDAERLACYDALAKRENAQAPAAGAAAQRPTGQQPSLEPAATELETSWELRPDLKRGTFRLRPYRPVYALLHITSDIDNEPSSPTRPVGTRDVQLDRAEVKLQFSLKSKLAQDLFGSATDLWFGYTQQSYWQAANGRYSSPFRETNYQPELILIHPLRFEAGGVHGRYVGAAFAHESNGRGESLSRSWNRLIGDAAVEAGPWSFSVRPWIRVDPSSGEDDDNPDIEDFVGRGELIAAWRNGRQVVTFTGRHSLRSGDRSRGSVRLDWAFPVTGNLDGHVQLFTGYGESLIDYNHRQTTLGVGVSFFD